MRGRWIEDKIYPRFGGGGSSGSSGGSGGGGGSGAVSYPSYMETRHQTALDDLYADMQTAQASNPYTSVDAFDPDAYIDGMLASLAAFSDLTTDFANASFTMSALATALGLSKTSAAQSVETLWSSYLSTISSGLGAQLSAQISTMKSDVGGVITAIDSDIDGIATAMNSSLDSIVTSMKSDLSDSYVDDQVKEYSDMLQDDIERTVLPKFEAGMRNANAVMSSAFVIGEALIFAEKDRQVSKFGADLTAEYIKAKNDAIVKADLVLMDANAKMAILEADAEAKARYSLAENYVKAPVVYLDAVNKVPLAMLDAEFKRMDFERLVTNVISDVYIKGMEFKRATTIAVVDALKSAIVAKKEEYAENIKLDVAEAKWVVELYQPWANMLASIGGGVAGNKDPDKPGQAASVVGGMMSGAAAGAAVGYGLQAAGMVAASSNPIGWGLGIGAVLGGALGLFD